MPDQVSNRSAYGIGQNKAVTDSLKQRTVDNSAAYLKDQIKPHMKILDVGCGPGSISCDFARLASQGHVTGVDIETAAETLEKARTQANADGILNVEFAIGDALALAFPDNSFDIVHSHQLLQHIADPVQVLREMRRVAKPGGIVACREIDSLLMQPLAPEVEAHMRLLGRMSVEKGYTPRAGRHLHVWARAAGFDPAHVSVSASTWCFRTRSERAIWAGHFIGMVEDSEYTSTAVRKGYAGSDELKKMGQGWKDWVDDEDGLGVVTHVEILCKV